MPPPGYLPSLLPLLQLMMLLPAVICSGPVYIRHGPRHQRVRAGTAVRFSCAAGTDSLLAGRPNITWRRDDVLLTGDSPSPLPDDPGAALDDSQTAGRGPTARSSLYIAAARSRDTGLYSCVAALHGHTDTASAQLIVENVPDPPIDVRLMRCDGRYAQLEWRLISENYSPVHQFIIQYNTSFQVDEWHVAKTQLPRDRTFQRIALSPYGNYSFRVLAQNAVGVSRPSEPTAAMCTTPPDVPHHNPRHVCTLNRQPKTLIIRWEAMPRTSQNAQGFHYVVRWRRHDRADEQFVEEAVPGDAHTLEVPHQPVYKPYELYVLAVNEVGEAVSPPRMVIGYSGEDVPLETPLHFALDADKEVTATTADFVWEPVNRGPWRMQGFFRGYKVEYWRTRAGPASLREHSIIYREPGACWSGGAGGRGRRQAGRGRREAGRRRRQAGQQRTGHLYNLWPNTNITARIRALNAKYEGPPSAQLTFRTAEGVPDVVAGVAVSQKGTTHLSLRWEGPLVANGLLTGYTVSYQALPSDTNLTPEDLGEEDLGEGPVRMVWVDNPRAWGCRLKALEPGTQYVLTVWAHTQAGRGVATHLLAATLPAGAPVVPNFTAVNISKHAVNVTWFPSTPGGNPGTVFTVQYRRQGEAYWMVTREERRRDWLVLESLKPGVVYELRVMARNGDGPDSQETPSATQQLKLGIRQELFQPSFKVQYRPTLSEVGIGLLSFSQDVIKFYVQYRRQVTLTYVSDTKPWHVTADVGRDEWAIIRHLHVGETYEVRVVVSSETAQASSPIQLVVVGTEPVTVTNVQYINKLIKLHGNNTSGVAAHRHRSWGAVLTLVTLIHWVLATHGS